MKPMGEKTKMNKVGGLTIPALYVFCGYVGGVRLTSHKVKTHYLRSL